MSQVAVIGGGFGGIACCSQASSQEVTNVILYERLNALGGRAQVFKKNNYIHDAGPTVITAPYLFYELFELFGEKLDDSFGFQIA